MTALIHNPTRIALYVYANRLVNLVPEDQKHFRFAFYKAAERHRPELAPLQTNARQLELERNVMEQVTRGTLIFVRQWIETPVTSDGHYLNFLSHLSPPLPVGNPPSPWDMFERRDSDLVLTAPEIAAWFGMRWWAEQN